MKAIGEESQAGGFVGEKYREQSQHQQHYNDSNNKQLAILAARWFQANEREHGIAVCDLGCGHGQPTLNLYHELSKLGIKIHEMVGYDISESQIAEACRIKAPENLRFETQDIQELKDTNKFDLMCSWFTLHWMNNLEQAREHIFRALKPGGYFVFLVPLEKPTLWSIRKELATSEEWRHKFSGFDFKPFKYYNCSSQAGVKGYEDIFAEVGRQDYQHTTRGTTTRTFTREQFTAFLKSWMQELRIEVGGVRAFTDADQTKYINDIIQKMQIRSPDPGADVKALPNGLIEFTEHYVFSVWQKPPAPHGQYTLWQTEEAKETDTVFVSSKYII